MINILKKYKRRVIQLTTAILYNLNFKGFKNANIYTGNVKSICVPGLNCYSCPGAIASCPIGSLQKAYKGRWHRGTFIDKIPFYAVGLIILFAVVFGRVICGFLCPFGLIQEILYKIRTPKIHKNKLTRKLTNIKYIILILFIIIVPVLTMVPSFCKYICPAGTLEAGIFFITVNEQMREIVGFLFTWKVIVLITVIVFSIFMHRFFCRFICPLGAIYGLFNKVAVFGLKIDENKCTHCNACINNCLMDVKRVGDRECIECGECIKKCKEKAIYRFSKVK